MKLFKRKKKIIPPPPRELPAKIIKDPSQKQYAELYREPDIYRAWHIPDKPQHR